MKRFLSLLLALVLICSVGATAFAAGDGTVTISNAKVGEIYSIYKLFDLESFSGDAYTYTINSSGAWYSFFNTGAGKDYVALAEYGTGKYIVTAKAGFTAESAANLATAALAYAKANSIGAVDSKEATDATVTFTGLDLGYYLVDTSLGTLCSLNTTDKNAEIEEKNSVPTVDKEVKEDSTDAWGKVNTADIAQVVEYKSEITNIGTVVNLVFRDTMTNLTFNGVSEIKLNDTTVIAGSNYTVTPVSGGGSFTVEFEDSYLATLEETDDLVIYYSGTLDASAVIGGTEGNPNECYITYGNKQESEHDIVKTFTYEINIIKYAVIGEAETALAGVEFILYRGTGESIQYAQLMNRKISGWTSDRGLATTLVTDEAGMIYIKGLDVDKYYLEETKEPAGYNKLLTPVEIVIAEGGSFSSDTHTVGNTEYFVKKIENKTGSILPSTGGIGTTIFYIVGSILLIGAGVLLVTRRRMRSGR